MKNKAKSMSKEDMSKMMSDLSKKKYAKMTEKERKAIGLALALARKAKQNAKN